MSSDGKAKSRDLRHNGCDQSSPAKSDRIASEGITTSGENGRFISAVGEDMGNGILSNEDVHARIRLANALIRNRYYEHVFHDGETGRLVHTEKEEKEMRIRQLEQEIAELKAS